jgi:hypothetical protein
VEMGRGGSWPRRAGAGAITLPKPLALSCDRVTGTTIHRRFTPFNPRVTHPPPPLPRARVSWSRPSPRLLATSSRRTLYGARTTLFVCFQLVCARTRRYAISVSGMRVTGPVRVCGAYSYASLTKKRNKSDETRS